MSDRLPPEIAKKYWKKFKQDGDGDLRDALITNYLHLVKYVVGRVASGLPSHVRMEDLYSTGVMGLIKAVEKYDPTMKNKFETYAILLIKGAIIDELRSLDWVPRSIHQKANMITKAQNELQQSLGREATDPELAEHLKMDLQDLEELMIRVRPAILLSLNDDSDEDEDRGTMADRIPDQKAKVSHQLVDRKELAKELEEAILGLPDQERMVLVLYYYENLMLKEVGEVLGVSESRISQIHTKAVSRLRGRLHGVLGEFASIFQ